MHALNRICLGAWGRCTELWMTWTPNLKKVVVNTLTKLIPQSHCTCFGKPVLLKIINNASMTVSDFIFLIGTASGYFDDIHKAVKRYLFTASDGGKGSARSIFNFEKTSVMIGTNRNGVRFWSPAFPTWQDSQDFTYSSASLIVFGQKKVCLSNFSLRLVCP